MASNKPITVKLYVEKEKKQLVYLECGNDFVDVLFSFLTLPIGTIIRLIGDKSEIGCIDKLFNSAKDLDVEHFETEECKRMLLNPRNASEVQLKGLKVQIDNTEPTKYYLCSSSYCGFRAHRSLLSTVKNARCKCGQFMNKEIPRQKLCSYPDSEVGTNGVFVGGTTRFTVTDDFVVTPMSTMPTLLMMKKLGMDTSSIVEERTVEVGIQDVLELLRYALISSTPISNVFLTTKKPLDHEPHLNLRQKSTDLRGSESNRGQERMTMKLLVSKSNSKLLCAEVGEDMVELFFTFLTYPLGSIVKTLQDQTSMASVDNLYQSVKNLRNHGYLISRDRKNILLDPKLALSFASVNGIHGIEELSPLPFYTSTCSLCHEWKIEHFVTTDEDACSRCCIHGKGVECLTLMDPKCSNDHLLSRRGRGRFVKGPSSFSVTDDLIVKPLVSNSFFSRLKTLSIEDVAEYVISIDEDDALNLLKASLVSKSALHHLVEDLKHDNGKSMNLTSLDLTHVEDSNHDNGKAKNFKKRNRNRRVHKNKNRNRMEFEVGDFVWAILTKHQFYMEEHNFTTPRKVGPYEIVSKIDSSTYSLNLPSHIRVSCIFNANHLIRFCGNGYDSGSSGSRADLLQPVRIDVAMLIAEEYMALWERQHSKRGRCRCVLCTSNFFHVSSEI